jgi:oxygen-dependent protoporphyrinogen oxidase
VAEPTPDVVIVGGGISGLSAALTLAKRDVGFLLLEASDHWGGVIRTERAGGFLLEAGPDALLAQKPEAVALCRELGLGERLTPTHRTARAVYVLHRGRLRALPEGMTLAVPTRIAPFLASGLFSWPGKLRMGLELMVPAKRDGRDESIASFLGRRFGGECVARLGEPLLAGIHSGDAERLSIRATFPRFVDLEVRYGSLIRGLRATVRRPRDGAEPPPLFYSLPGGLAEMVDALVSRLPAERLRLASAVRSVDRSEPSWSVAMADGRRMETRAVIVAAPAHRSAALLASFDPELGRSLAAIPFVSTATVLLGFRRADIAHPLNGYGLIVPKTEGLRTTALSFSSTKLPGRAPEGHVLLRAFLGGARDPQALAVDDEGLVKTVLTEMTPVLGVRGTPLLTRVCRWPMGTPQMEVGHLDRIALLEKRVAGMPGLHLTGAGIRVTGIPDSIADGSRVANAVADWLKAS